VYASCRQLFSQQETGYQKATQDKKEFNANKATREKTRRTVAEHDSEDGDSPEPIQCRDMGSLYNLLFQFGVDFLYQIEGKSGTLLRLNSISRNF